MKKQIIHFSLGYGVKRLTACGADIQSNFLFELKITDRRNRVTCGQCKRTTRFRKIRG